MYVIMILSYYHHRIGKKTSRVIISSYIFTSSFPRENLVREIEGDVAKAVDAGERQARQLAAWPLDAVAEHLYTEAQHICPR